MEMNIVPTEAYKTPQKEWSIDINNPYADRFKKFVAENGGKILAVSGVYDTHRLIQCTFPLSFAESIEQLENKFREEVELCQPK